MKACSLVLLGLMAAASAVLASTDIETPAMEVGTNFWDIGWGGVKNQPFKTSYNEFESSEDPWNPQFLEELKIYSCFRFMDWIKTNSVEREWERGNQYHRDWASRVKPDDPLQRPVAWEWMIDLCNRTRRDMWITVPHVVDDDYVHKLAGLIKSRLSPDLQCYVEWSNETWNGSFTQSRYCNEKGQQLPDKMLEGCKYSKSNEWYTGQVYHAKRTLEIHGIFLDVFGDENRKRLVLVMGGSMIHAFYRDSHLFAIRNEKINPREIKPDAYALAPYVGHGLTPDDPRVFEQLMGPAMEKRLTTLRKIVPLMKEHGIPVVCYEGGQHIKHTLKGVIALQKRPEMYDVYTKYLTELSRHVTHFSHYTHTGGSWGAKEFIGEDLSQAPKYRALRDWSELHNRAAK